MKKQIKLHLLEELKKDLIKVVKNDFDPIDVGNAFIELGEFIKKETNKITNLSLTSQFKNDFRTIGNVFDAVFEYDTVEEATKDVD